MIALSIESIVVAVTDIDQTAAAYRRLGLEISPRQTGPDDLIIRTLAVGSFDPLSVIRLIQPSGHDIAHHPLRIRAEERLRSGEGSGAIAAIVQVPDVREVIATLAARGVKAGCVLDGPFAWLDMHDQAGVCVGLVEDPWLPDVPGHHQLALNRMDHLAIVSHDLETTSRFWTESLGLPIIGEIRTDSLIIRQIEIGDCIVELLGAPTPDCPIAKRPAGLLSMVSWEVANLDEAVQIARRQGFAPSDPAKGPLPGTRIATIPGDELGGLNLQLLEYV